LRRPHLARLHWAVRECPWLENFNHVYNLDELNIDVDKSIEVIRAAKPGIVTFGGSLFLFPHPIRELRAVCEEVGAYVAYDASHVLGLIAGGVFQDPLREGAISLRPLPTKRFQDLKVEL